MQLSTFQADLWLSPVVSTENKLTLWKKICEVKALLCLWSLTVSYSLLMHKKVKNGGLDPFIATTSPTMLLYFSQIQRCQKATVLLEHQGLSEHERSLSPYHSRRHPCLRTTNGYMYYIKNGLLIKMQIVTLQEHALNKEAPWFKVCIIYFILQWVTEPVTVEK